MYCSLLLILDPYKQHKDPSKVHGTQFGNHCLNEHKQTTITITATTVIPSLSPLVVPGRLGTAVAGECVERFLNTMSTCVGERIFITDYCSAYPITADLQTFTVSFLLTRIISVIVNVHTREVLGSSDSSKERESNWH